MAAATLPCPTHHLIAAHALHTWPVSCSRSYPLRLCLPLNQQLSSGTESGGRTKRWAAGKFGKLKVKTEAAAEDALGERDRKSSKLNKSVVVIDNYDSFTYNLCQFLGELGCSFEVYRNDELTIEQLQQKEPCGILISPGPGTPHDSGISLETVLKLGPTIPLFGVCMGLQCIGEAFGGKIVRSPYGVMHGKKSMVYYDEHGEDGLLAGLPNPFVAGRYHSLVIDKDSFPNDKLEITAWTEDGLIMGVRHREFQHIQGVQFHPESIITQNGLHIVRNFLGLLC